MAIKSVYPSRGPGPNRRKTAKNVKKAVKHNATYKNTRRTNVAKPKTARTKSHGLKRFLHNIFRQRSGVGEVDYSFLLLVVILTIFGLIMLLSASTPTASVKFKNSYHFFLRQLLCVAIGSFFMFIFANVDYKRFKPYVNGFFWICVVLLALVFAPVIGVTLNGASRWINLGFMLFQPSELAKLSVAMYYALMIERRRFDLTTAKGFFLAVLGVGIIALLMMCETHLSGTIVICAIAFCILLVGGSSLKIISGFGAVAMGLGFLYLRFDDTRWARVLSLFNRFEDSQGVGYQTLQSLYAIGSGGIFGKGLGQSVQKFSYLPEPYNDFIFSIVCEELGLLGAAFIIFLFGYLIYRGTKIALGAPDKFGFLTVVGIMTQIAVQIIMNIAVTTATVPNTGVSLPFFSYGGTAIMILLAEMGIVLSISRYSTKKMS